MEGNYTKLMYEFSRSAVLLKGEKSDTHLGLVMRQLEGTWVYHS